MSGPVAVAVLHYGSVALTAACLRSTFALEPAPDHRIVLWNDPATDPTGLEAALRDGPVHAFEIVETGENLGFGGGANRAAERAAVLGATWLWLLNNDTEVAPDALVILRGAASDPAVAIAGPRILSLGDGRLWHDGGTIEWPVGRPTSPGYGAAPSAPGDAHEVDFVCGCAPLIRLDPFRALGGFDERYFTTYEDTDLGVRLAAAGHRSLHVPRAEVRHHGSASIGEGSLSQRYYTLRNRRLFRDLHAPDPEDARRAAAAEARRERARAFRYRWSGRGGAARAIRAALEDHASGRYGRWEA